MISREQIRVSSGLAVAVVLGVWGLAFGQGAGYRTSVGTGSEEIPVAVVSGTPYQMGYQSGQLMATEIQAFVPSFLVYAQADLDFVLSAGQGEFTRCVVAPGDAEEAFRWSAVALNVAWNGHAKNVKHGWGEVHQLAIWQCPAAQVPFWWGIDNQC